MVEYVDEVCDRFEAAWPAKGSAGPRPRIEDFLGDLPEPGRSLLLRELLRLELAYRREAGELLRPEPYQQRFPQQREMIHELFRQGAASQAASAPSSRGANEGNWYFAQGKRKKGPLSWDRLRRIAAAGHLRPQDMVLHEGAGKWVPAASLPNLFPQTPISSQAITVRPTQADADAHPTGQAVSGSLTTVPNVKMPSVPPDQPAFPDVRGFQIIRLLGQGGMGVVYLARNLRSNRIEALKMIRADSLAGMTTDQRRSLVSRFRTEYQAAARIQHDHVVTVYEVGESGGCPYYSMRYVEGHSLADVIREGPVPSARAAALLEPVVWAVHFMHGHDILHRDIKPRNILVDAADRTYVTDFGLAKWLASGQDMTQTGDRLGTPSYMAPEQAKDAGKVTAASDVYSLGATLYALLTGRPPFQAATVAETLHQLKYQEPVPLRRLNPGIARDLETITLKCLHKDPARRYLAAAELADDLRCFRESRPIRARPVGRAERAWRWCQRNRVVANLLGTVILLLISLPTVAVIGYFNTMAASEEAQSQEKKALREADRANTILYDGDMLRCSRALGTQDTSLIYASLNKNYHRKGWADPRDWEWFFLKRLLEADELPSLRKGGAFGFQANTKRCDSTRVRYPNSFASATGL
jgi:serine/threonine protein kinase